MKKNRAGLLKGKNNNNLNIGESSNSPTNWVDIDRATYENCFCFNLNSTSDLNTTNSNQPSCSGIDSTAIPNGSKNCHPINSTYAEDSEDDIFGIGASTNHCDGDQNFALNSALSFQKFLCSSSKKPSSSKMPNIQSSNEFENNQKRLEDELKSLNRKLEATKKQLTMMYNFIEQRTNSYQPNTFQSSSQPNALFTQQVNQYSHPTFEPADNNIIRSTETNQQFFSAIKKQHDLINNQNDRINDQNELILNWFHSTQNLSHQSSSQTMLDSSLSHVQNSRHHPGGTLFVPNQNSATSYFPLILNENRTRNVTTTTSTIVTPSAPPGVVNATLNNQIRPRIRENNFVDNFRSLSHQNDLHYNPKNEFTSAFAKLNNPFEFGNMLKNDRTKLNNFQPTSSTVIQDYPSSSTSAFPYQTSILNNNTLNSSQLGSNVKFFRGPSRIPKTALGNLKNFSKSSGEEKNLKRPKKSNLNQAIGGGLERHYSNSIAHDDEDIEHNDPNHIDQHVNRQDKIQDENVDDHDSVDEASQQMMKLIVGTSPSNTDTTVSNSSLFHHSTKLTSARPLMPAEGQSSEPIQAPLMIVNKKCLSNTSVSPSVSINTNGWSYRPPATGSTNGLTDLSLQTSTSVLSMNTEDRLDEHKSSMKASHSESAVINVYHSNENNILPECNEQRSIINHRRHVDNNNLNNDQNDDDDEDDFVMNSADDTDVRIISFATAGTDSTVRHSSIRHSGDGEQGL